jgi:hypothetical protein
MSIDPSIRLAVIDATREELGRALGPVVDQLKHTLGNIENKLEKIEQAERDSDRNHLLTDGKIIILETAVRGLQKTVDELQNKADALTETQTGISTRMAIFGAVTMVVVNGVIAALVVAGMAAVGVG